MKQVIVDILNLSRIVIRVIPLEINAGRGGGSTMEKIYIVCGILLEIPVISGSQVRPRLRCYVNYLHRLVRYVVMEVIVKDRKLFQIVIRVIPLEINARDGGLSTMEKIYNVCGILVEISVLYGTPEWDTAPRIRCNV